MMIYCLLYGVGSGNAPAVSLWTVGHLSGRRFYFPKTTNFMFNTKTGISASILAEGYKCITRGEKSEISQYSTPNQGDLTPLMKLYPMDLEFTKHGYKYSQVLKTDEIVIYQAQDESITFFEIFSPKIIAIAENNKVWSKQFAEGYTHVDLYPSNSDFGDWAWCCRGLKAVSRVLATHFPGVDVDLSLLQKGGRA